MEPYAGVVEQFTRFAADAHDESPCFEAWALGVVEDRGVQSLLADLPPGKQQPNLVFAAARWRGLAAPSPYADLRRHLLTDWPGTRAVVLSRSTQTNEVGRLATLLPAFAGLGRRLALVEVGASAGLCLFPDRYSYRYVVSGAAGRAGARVELGSGRRLNCAVHGTPPLPTALPEVAWRVGIDLNPLDVRDADAMAWLRILVWPEHRDRLRRLAAAIAIARGDPPMLVRGNLLTELPAVLDRAPGDTAVVVFHSAVVAYLEPRDRRRFAALMAGLVAGGRCHWVSNEAPNVLPEVTETGPPVPENLRTFVLGVDGRAVAWTHGHGASMTWLASAPPAAAVSP